MRRNHSLPTLQTLLKILILALCLFGYSAHAKKDDTQQAINIEADRAEISEAEGISTYSGNVILRQGSIEIKADTIMIYTHDGQLQRITASGKPVHYKQQRENDDDVLGISQRMEYLAESKRLLLMGNAELTQGKNRFSGHRIQYDPKTERVIATSDTSKDPNASKNGSSTRVTITLQPTGAKNSTDNKSPRQP